MVTIKDIYQWCDVPENAPRPLSPSNDLNLTQLQYHEWREKNAKRIKDFEDKINDYKNKSFIGEILRASPVLITSISIHLIIAKVIFEGPRLSQPLHVHYNISYDKTLFYETLRLIHNQSIVELEGEILKFSHENYVHDVNWGGVTRYRIYNIELNLSKIKFIKKQLPVNPDMEGELLLSDEVLLNDRQLATLKRAENQNYNKSVKNGISNGILWGIGGVIAAVVLGIFLNLVSCVNNNTSNFNAETIYSSMMIGGVIGGILGYYFGFNEK